MDPHSQSLESPADSSLESPLKSQNLLLTLAYVAVFSAGFWVIDHTPFASDYFKVHSIIAETDNRTADRIESVNLISAPVRICLGMFGVAFLLMPSRRKLNWGGILFALIVAFLLFSGLSTLWSINPSVSAQKFLVLSFFGLAAYGTARQMNIRELALVFTLICVTYIAVGVLAEIALGNFTPYKKDYRFVGTCHPNSLAVYGTFSCLVALVYFNKFKELNHWLVLLFILGIVTLVMTRSRTTLAAFAFGAVAAWFLTFKPNNRVFAISASVLFFVFVCVTLVLARSNIKAAAAEKLAMGRTKDVSSLTGRLPLWELLLESVEEKPLIGHGYLAFWDKDRIEFLSDQLKWEVPHGHNMYIDVLLDGGIVGLAIYAMIFFVAIMVAGYRSVMFNDRDATLVFGFLTFAIVHGFAESLFKLPTFLLFMLLAMVLRMAFENRHGDSLPNDQPELVGGAV